ncbi:MAG: HAMP domain-containing histidine kinase [Planctomycetes bacterium]|nr:HAMP domain-containing histidine kinase [Planctomycetota bacterium]
MDPTHTQPSDDLAQRLHRLNELETRFDQLLEQAKLEAMYNLAAGAGHEINNPLGSIAGWAQLLLRDEPDKERRRTLAKINAQAFRAHEMIADMMLFARPPEPVMAEVDLVPLVDEALAGLSEEAARRSTRLLRLPGEAPIVVRADRVQIYAALRAMCVNALEAIGADGNIDVTIQRAVRPQNGLSHGADRSVSDAAEIIIRDDGPGIAPQVRRHLFDPFFSGREAGRGLGFGLSKCWRIVTNHGGSIDVASEAGHGARFTISLPANQTTAAPSKAQT